MCCYCTVGYLPELPVDKPKLAKEEVKRLRQAKAIEISHSKVNLYLFSVCAYFVMLTVRYLVTVLALIR